MGSWAALLAATIWVNGLIVEVSPERGTVTVSHREVPGVMPAMAMPVAVKDRALLRALRPGMLVELELGSKRIKVRKADNSIEEDGRRVALQAPKETIPPGGRIPPVSLTNHRGQAISLNQFTGKVVVVQFLYTRCPMPEVCPRLAATFAALQRRFAAQMNKDLVLLSITLDPRYDTVQELSRYAEIWRTGPGWHFLTGSEDQIKSAAACFGLVYWPEEGVITHTSTIGVIGRDGTLSATVEGLGFTARQLGDLIEQQLK